MLLLQSKHKQRCGPLDHDDLGLRSILFNAVIATPGNIFQRNNLKIFNRDIVLYMKTEN